MVQSDMHPRPRIVVVGSANTDLVVRVAKLPQPGETVLGGEFSQVGGGKGANQAVAAARAGGQVTFVAKLGDDDLADAAIRSYEAEGIDTRYVTRTQAVASGVALILIDAAGENAIAVASGANSQLAPADIDAATDAIAAADLVLVQLEIPLDTVRRTVALATAAGRTVVLNPAPARPLDAELLAGVRVITPNETEAALLTGLTVTNRGSAAAAAAMLASRGVAQAIVTLGREGCVVLDPRDAAGPQHLAGHPVTAVDTVAAGDVFNGSLAVALAEGRSLSDAATFANAAAAIAVTRCGAQTSAPTRSEIDAMLRRGPYYDGAGESRGTE
jgi:ribokinase